MLLTRSRSLMWFRQDLRLHDNPAFFEACKADQCLAVFIIDTSEPALRFQPGAASKIWLQHSLQQLNKSLGGQLMFYKGDAKRILFDLIEKFGIDALYWNRCYEPWQIKRDQDIKENCRRIIECKSFNGQLLWEPWQVMKQDGKPYKVFTPFYQRGCLSSKPPREPLQRPTLPSPISDMSAVKIEQLGLIHSHPYSIKLQQHVSAGESSALQKLDHFIETCIDRYKRARDIPAEKATSRLSPHLHFGEISPNQVWSAVVSRVEPNKNRDDFLSELAWREFSYYLLYHFPGLPTENFQRKFNDFPWQDNDVHLKAWQKGRTGYPIIDAGMRELWQTGWMHNRVRMIVGSFLVKNLRLHWHHGERWFWDCLFDADLASNSASWQWVAGSGADAAPYFRIFNPTLQARKFDSNGDYIRRFVPELTKLPIKYLFEPWQAPDEMLSQSGITLGEDYPYPIIDLKQSREQALEAFANLSYI